MKLRNTLVFPFTVSIALVGCSSSREVDTSVNIDEVRKHLKAVSGARILLGHQSVGGDILSGVSALTAEAGVDLRIEEIAGVPSSAGPGLFHSKIGQNGDPDGKCEAFGQLLTRPERPQYDLAMMKFCYADLGRDPSIEAEGMLKRYSALVTDLREQRPDVRLMHISLPLRSDPKDWKTPIKRMLGRDIPDDYANAVRNTFNDGLRAQYSNERFFDLAAFESTYGDGSRSSFSYRGRTVYTLAREYTHDGGHLNPAAQRMAAAQFLKTLAAALPVTPAKKLSDARVQ
jgi:hypothetical protein